MLRIPTLHCKYSAVVRSHETQFTFVGFQRSKLRRASAAAAERCYTLCSRRQFVAAYSGSQQEAVRSLDKESSTKTRNAGVPAEVHFGSPPSEGFAPAAQGTLFGAIALITGSTVGAGMLALPSVTAPVGFGPTATLLVGLWALLTVEALLIAEVNLNVRAALQASHPQQGNGSTKQQGGASPQPAGTPAAASAGTENIVTLRQMAEYTLGDAGKGFTFVYLGLAYSLLVAYISKASEVVGYFTGGALPPAANAVAYVAALAALLFVGGTKGADTLNQGLTSLLLLLFAVILASGGSQVDWPQALAHSQSDWAAAPQAVPIIFLALVYHDLVPVICTFLGGDRKAIRAAIVLGSLMPLAMFLSWEAVALNMLPQALVGGHLHPPPTLPDPSLLREAAYHPPTPAAPAGQLLGSFQQSLQGGVQGVSAAAGPGLQGATQEALAAMEVVGRVTLDPLQVLMRRSSPLVAASVEAFSFLTIMTSSLGVTLSLSATLRTDVPPLLHQLAQSLGLEAAEGVRGQEKAGVVTGGGGAGGSGTTAQAGRRLGWEEGKVTGVGADAATAGVDGGRGGRVSAAERQVLGSLEAELVGGQEAPGQQQGQRGKGTCRRWCWV